MMPRVEVNIFDAKAKASSLVLIGRPLVQILSVRMGGPSKMSFSAP